MDIEYALSLEFMNDHPVESARVLETLHPSQVAGFLKDIPPLSALGPLMAMEMHAAAAGLAILPSEKAGNILERMPIEAASVLLRRMDGEIRAKILQTLAPKDRDPLARLLEYSEGTAGSLMDSKAFSLPEDTPVEEALRRLRLHPDHIVDFLYVVDRKQMLRGVVSLRSLILAEGNDTVGSLAELPVRPIPPTAEKRTIVEHPGWKILHELPVALESGLFLGAIDYRTLRRLEGDLERQSAPEPAREAGGALGELYWLGLSGLLKGAAALVESKEPRENENPS